MLILFVTKLRNPSRHALLSICVCGGGYLRFTLLGLGPNLQPNWSDKKRQKTLLHLKVLYKVY